MLGFTGFMDVGVHVEHEIGRNPDLLQCNTEAAEGRESFREGHSLLECGGLRDHSAVAVPQGVAFPKLS